MKRMVYCYTARVHLLAYEISTQDAVPNLVPPHRRKVLARVQRNDGWAVTSLPIQRELVTIATKIRGGGGNPTIDTYQTQSFATAPIKGLVYTVVHDPPGGNSFSSISKGTKIDLELGLVTTGRLRNRAIGILTLELPLNLTQELDYRQDQAT